MSFEVLKEKDRSRNVFRTEVCRRYCMLCSAESPDFCLMVEEHLNRRYFEKVLFLINTARELRPKLYDDFDTFEGFIALFCDPHICPFWTSNCSVVKKVDCYQMFLMQSNMEFEPGEESDIVQSYQPRLVKQIIDGLNEVDEINKKQPKKKKKRLNKVIDRIIKSLSKWSVKNNCTGAVYKGGNNKPMTITPKKEVKTSFFCSDNEEFIQKIKSILEGNVQP